MRVGFLLVLSLAFGPVLASETLTVNLQGRRQTMDGFGASGAWWAQAAGKKSEGTKTAIADLLFDRNKGIGLSIFRYNLGAGPGAEIVDPWRRTSGIEVPSGGFDVGRDSEALWFVKAARSRGVESLVVFANSPPARLTMNRRVSGGEGGGSNLAESAYGAWAKSFIGQVKALNDAGYPVDWVSPINEPDVPWQVTNQQEGSAYTPAEVVGFLKTFIPLVRQELPGVRISSPENGKWTDSRSYLLALAKEPEVLAGIDRWSLHSYWSGLEDKNKTLAFFQKRAPQLGLWMSEYCIMEGGKPDLGMQSALDLARVIHEDLTVGSVASWQWWIAVSKYDYQDGLLYTDASFSQLKTSKRAWVLAQWSRHVRPGWVRVDAAAGDSQALVSAFVAPDGGQLAMVVVNPGAEELSLSLSQELAKGWVPVSRETTSATQDCQISPLTPFHEKHSPTCPGPFLGSNVLRLFRDSSSVCLSRVQSGQADL